jgi:GWxTD domain-containing protein
MRVLSPSIPGLAVPFALALLAGCGLAGLAPPAAAAVPPELAAWSEGPVRWLLQPQEQKELRRVRDSVAAAAFIEEFWQRRDPTPGEVDNPFRKLFFERVEAADALYSEEGTRGSLTARGQALILLGSPNHVSVSSRPALTWDTQSNSEVRMTTDRIRVEQWGYRLDNLPRGLSAVWNEKNKSSDEPLNLTLAFRTDTRRVQLIEGEELLKMAVQAAVRRP